MKELYNIYGIHLAKYLLNEKHFPLIATKQQEEDPTKTIFRFEKTDELMDAIEKYTNYWN